MFVFKVAAAVCVTGGLVAGVTMGAAAYKLITKK